MIGNIPANDISVPYPLALTELNDLLSSRRKCVIRCNIFPEVARWILENVNTKNRGVKNSRKKLAVAIRQGRWHFNGQTIGFSGDGILQDGQNRLYACVDTGTPIDVLMVFGLSPDSIRATDRGCVRTNADHISMRLGKDGLPSTYSSAISFWHRFVNQQFINKGFMPDADEVDAIVAERPGLRDSVEYVHRMTKQFPGLPIPKAMLAFYHYVLTEIDAVRGDEFISRLISGEDLRLNNPIMTLRCKVQDRVASRKRTKTIELQAFIHKCWNAFYRGDDLPMKALGLLKNWGPKSDDDGDRKRPRESFPTIMGQDKILSPAANAA